MDLKGARWGRIYKGLTAGHAALRWDEEMGAHLGILLEVKDHKWLQVRTTLGQRNVQFPACLHFILFLVVVTTSLSFVLLFYFSGQCHPWGWIPGTWHLNHWTDPYPNVLQDGWGVKLFFQWALWFEGSCVSVVGRVAAEIMSSTRNSSYSHRTPNTESEYSGPWF